MSRRRKPDREALSDANVSLINHWIRDCSKLHTECWYKSDIQLPARVIDVSPSDSSQQPRLVARPEELGDYVALSHCWGPLIESSAGMYARTLENNLNEMQRGIPFNLLPQNFQDAILTVQRLQLRYLWIDALCIIQDDPADWAREAAKMNGIYGSAYLTIAATSAISSTEGFLRRSQEMACSIAVYEATRTELAFRLTLTEMLDGGNQGSWMDSIEKARWNTRGWTFQERLLSKRVLHFTARKIFWECRMTDGSEENEPPRDPSYRIPWLREGCYCESGSLAKRDVRAPKACFDNWYSIVSMYAVELPLRGRKLTVSRYSFRELSYETDVLPALSGLAHSFEAVHKVEKPTDTNDYLAGIWRNDLPKGLLWTLHDSGDASRYSQYIAPTWSWASIKGQIHFPFGDLGAEESPKVLDVSIEQKTNDHLGAIVGAKLILFAKVRCLCEVVIKAYDSRFQLDLRLYGQTVGDGTFDVGFEGGLVWVMQCIHQKAWDYFDHPTLLLLHRPGIVPDTYERVGVGRLSEDSLALFDDCEPREVTLV